MRVREHFATFRWDVRYALRMMRRSPGFTFVAVASLALGIGANTAIFSLINTLMLRLLPVRDPERIVELLQKYPGEPRGNGFWTRRSYEHFRDNNHVFSGLIGFSASHFSVRGELQRLRVGLTKCIGCGCLSLDACQLANPGDRAARCGPGPRYCVTGSRARS